MLMSPCRKDASEQFDTDGDGIGNNADDDDDGDGYHDQTEANFATDPLNVMNYPYSGGRVGLAVLSDYSDRNRAFYEVVVKRHLSGQGEVSIDYRTSDGGAAVAGEHFEMVSGTLTWADGDQVPKVIQVPLLGGPGGTRAQYDFGVVLDNLQGNAMYDATMGRVVLDDTVIDPNWSGNILPAYRTVAAEGETARGSPRANRWQQGRSDRRPWAIDLRIIGARIRYVDAHLRPRRSWADGEVGPKVVTVPATQTRILKGLTGGGRQISPSVLRFSILSQRTALRKWFGQPWVGFGEIGPGAFSVMVIDDEAGAPLQGTIVRRMGKKTPVYCQQWLWLLNVDYDVRSNSGGCIARVLMKMRV